jgi:Tol biopolymer transport system component
VNLYVVDPNVLVTYSIRLPVVLKTAHEADLSPDGKWIVYSLGGDEAGEPGSDIYITDLQGKQTFRITNTLVSGENPTWSPNGKQILYNSYWKGTDYLVLQDITCILANEACNFEPIYLVEGRNPDWSPDAESIVYEHVDNNIFAVGIITVDNINTPLAATPAGMECRSPKWSPDGEKIVVSCGTENSMYVVDRDGSSFTKLGTHGRRPEWAPDGESIYYISSQGEDLGRMLGWEACRTNALFSVDINSGDVIRLTRNRNECLFWFALRPSQD